VHFARRLRGRAWWNPLAHPREGENTMKNILITLAMTMAAAGALAQAPAASAPAAAAASKPMSAQNSLMATCNTEATGKKGDERKAFMSTCLSDGKKRQQERMKICAAENKGKKGDEYKAAQKACLSGDKGNG
jgi:hypothetical protein